MALWPFACLGTEMQSMGVKTNKHPGDGARRRCFCQSTLCFHPVAEAHVPSYNQQPPSSCFPAVPSLQLSCICGAIPVRGGRQKYSLQSRGFGAGALFALGQTLDSSNILIFLLISQLLCCACASLYVSVHFDQ